MAGLKFRIFGGADDEISAFVPKARMGDAPTATAPKIPLEKKVRRFITGTPRSLCFSSRFHAGGGYLVTVARMAPGLFNEAMGNLTLPQEYLLFWGQSRVVEQSNHGPLGSLEITVRHA